MIYFFFTIALFSLLMWVVFVIPQQRRQRAHLDLVAALEVGTEVMTTAGVYGTITELDDDTVHLEVAPGVVIRIARQAILRRVDEPTPASAAVDDGDMFEGLADEPAADAASDAAAPAATEV
jgi:preprotein translocase subunit YajC